MVTQMAKSGKNNNCSAKPLIHLGRELCANFKSYAHAPEAWRARPLRRPPSALAREALANSVNSLFRKIAAALNARSVPAAKAGYGQPCRSGAWWNERRLGDETVQA